MRLPDTPEVTHARQQLRAVSRWLECNKGSRDLYLKWCMHETKRAYQALIVRLAFEQKEDK